MNICQSKFYDIPMSHRFGYIGGGCGYMFKCLTCSKLNLEHGEVVKENPKRA